MCGKLPQRKGGSSAFWLLSIVDVMLFIPHLVCWDHSHHTHQSSVQTQLCKTCYDKHAKCVLRAVDTNTARKIKTKIIKNKNKWSENTLILTACSSTDINQCVLHCLSSLMVKPSHERAAFCLIFKPMQPSCYSDLYELYLLTHPSCSERAGYQWTSAGRFLSP